MINSAAMSQHNTPLSSSAYRPSAAAMLPPPVPPSNKLSSSHSSGGKRKRSEGDSAVASSTSSSLHFSTRTKQRIAELNGSNACFQCGGGAPDICHVISRKDSSVCHAHCQAHATHFHTPTLFSCWSLSRNLAHTSTKIFWHLII